MSFRLLIAALCAAVLGLSVPAVAFVPATTHPLVTTNASADQQQVVIAKGHVDIGPKLIDGVWHAALRDDTVNPPVWRKLENVVLHVVDAAKTPVPESAEYKFLNLPAGSTPWVIPQTQNPDVVWVGWNTQDPEAAGLMGRGTNLILNKMTGPAPANLFLQDGGFGPPRVLWQTDKGAGQPIWMEVNSHVHMNWVFAEAGDYAFDLTMTAEAGDPAPSARGTLRVVVGSTTAVDTPAAPTTPTVAAAEDAAAAAKSQPTASTNTAAAAEKAAASGPSPLVWLSAGGAAVVLFAAVALVLWRQRKAREQSVKEFAGQS